MSNIFAELGIDIVDADLIARQVVQPNSEGLKQLVGAFGEQCLNDQAELDRTYLRKLVFHDLNAKKVIESILHPLIRKEIMNQLSNSSSQYCILSAPLLLETGLEQYADTILVVDVPENIQLQRTMQRDQSDEKTVQAIIGSQIKRDDRLTRANDIIDNNGNISSLTEQITELHKKYLQNVALQVKDKG